MFFVSRHHERVTAFHVQVVEFLFIWTAGMEVKSSCWCYGCLVPLTGGSAVPNTGTKAGRAHLQNKSHSFHVHVSVRAPT